MMVKQVRPAPGSRQQLWPSRPITSIGFPGARIPSWPGVLGDSSKEAGDTFAVRPVSPPRSNVNGNVPMTGTGLRRTD